jgi:hypothetical protein
LASNPELFVEAGKCFRDGAEADAKLDLRGGECARDPVFLGFEFVVDFGDSPGGWLTGALGGSWILGADMRDELLVTLPFVV